MAEGAVEPRFVPEVPVPAPGEHRRGGVVDRHAIHGGVVSTSPVGVTVKAGSSSASVLPPPTGGRQAGIAAPGRRSLEAALQLNGPPEGGVPTQRTT